MKKNTPAVLLAIFLLVLWQIIAMVINAAYILPSPVQIAQKIWDLKANLFLVQLPATMSVTAVGLVISIAISKNIYDIVINTLIIALSTNLMNLLDLRPGRAIKGYLVISIVLLFTLGEYTRNLLLLIFPNVIAYFNQDLKAKAMMGDTGSNVLGISIGILFVMGYSLKVRLIWLAFLIFIHILTEKYSLTKIIESNKFLNFIDKLGR